LDHENPFLKGQQPALVEDVVFRLALLIRLQEGALNADLVLSQGKGGPGALQIAERLIAQGPQILLSFRVRTFGGLAGVIGGSGSASKQRVVYGSCECPKWTGGELGVPLRPLVVVQGERGPERAVSASDRRP